MDFNPFSVINTGSCGGKTLSVCASGLFCFNLFIPGSDMKCITAQLSGEKLIFFSNIKFICNWVIIFFITEKRFTTEQKNPNFSTYMQFLIT